MEKIIGLSSLEAERRFQTNGPNEVVSSQLESSLSEIKEIFIDPMGLMLLGLGSLYAALGKTTDALVLFVAYIPVTGVDVVLKLKSRRALHALKRTLKKSAKVFRDGGVQEISTRKIVIGDVILFEEGQSIPADGTVLESHELMMNESALTGESLPVEKSVTSPFYGGTVVLQGRGLGTIEGIGKNTRFGKIATLLKETEGEQSPLQKKVNHLIKRVFVAALFLALLLFVIEYQRSHLFAESLIVALTFGMAAVPEEFPLVFTLYLSLGAWRLSRHGVLVKSLPSVETLGSVDVICTDKTGTLTEGKFKLEELRPLEKSLKPEQIWLFALMACEKEPIDSMETAIYEKGVEFQPSLKDWSLKWDYAFELSGKHMSHVWENAQTKQTVIAMKGAIEGVLDHCDLDSPSRFEFLKLAESIAGQGKRLLGLAYREGGCNGSRENDEKKLKFAGILIFSDPIRTSIKDAILACQAADIQIKMLTGDHPFTAHAVADETGIAHGHDQLFTGDQLMLMSHDQRFSAYQKGVIFSRVRPEQKHEMVQALKQSGLVVAMTGDGINDAPALKLADIGISMGLSATDVARSAAQMVLLKNDFNGIVQAVFEGRRIFSNLRRSFSYLVSFHIPVIFLALIPPLLGWGDLFLPSHIILLELIVHPISAFSFENLAGEGVVREKGFFTVRRFLESALSGVLLSVGSLILFRHYQTVFDLTAARSISLVTIFFGNLGFVILESWPVLTRRLWFTTLSLLFLSGVVVWMPAVSGLFHLGTIGPVQMLLALSVGLSVSIPTVLVRNLIKVKN